MINIQVKIGVQDAKKLKPEATKTKFRKENEKGQRLQCALVTTSGTPVASLDMVSREAVARRSSNQGTGHTCVQWSWCTDYPVQRRLQAAENSPKGSSHHRWYTDQSTDYAFRRHCRRVGEGHNALVITCVSTSASTGHHCAPTVSSDSEMASQCDNISVVSGASTIALVLMQKAKFSLQWLVLTWGL